MSGFSAAWLKLREPADHRARDQDLLRRLNDALAGRPALTIVDLGCGTGSNLRALAPHLAPAQHWTLVDHDPALLAAARDELRAWADEARDGPDGSLHLAKGDRALTVAFRAADLARDLDAALGPQADLVTAAALFDLVSDAFIARTAAAVASRRALFYTALTYDGVEAWSPPHPADEAIHAAFLAHQGRDKGFGPASGPGASRTLAAAFRTGAYTVVEADTPWRLSTPEDAALMAELAHGTAEAVCETGEVAEAEVSAWRGARLKAATACSIGHTDLLALPPPAR